MNNTSLKSELISHENEEKAEIKIVKTSDENNYQRAPNGLRYIARLIDWIIYSCISSLAAALVVAISFKFFNISSTGGMLSTDDKINLISLATSIVFGFLYFVLYPNMKGYTIGKKIMGLKIIRMDNHDKKLGIIRLLLRETIGRLISAILLIGYFMILFRKDGRSLHDMIGSTQVVK